MPLTDPPDGFDPIAMQHAANVRMRGFEHSGAAAEALEREGAAQAHAAIPGGGVRWHRTIDPAEPDVLLDPDARLRALKGW